MTSDDLPMTSDDLPMTYPPLYERGSGPRWGLGRNPLGRDGAGDSFDVVAVRVC